MSIGLNSFSIDNIPILILNLGLWGWAKLFVFEFVAFFKALSEAGECFYVVLLLLFLESLDYN